MLGKKKKSQKRIRIIERIVAILTHPEIYGTIDYRKASEDKIKQFIYQPLLNELQKIYVKKKNLKEEAARKKARKNLRWEGNVKTTIHNYLFLGAYHRPDMEIIYDDDMRIAIEVKKGDQGTAIRQGIGQCMVHSSAYDFVIYLFVDTSKEKKISSSVSGKKEAELLEALWNDYNIKFVVA